jgi:transposase-like protein
MPTRLKIDCDELRRLYEEEEYGTVALAQHYGCSPATISNRLRDCGIAVRSSRFQPVDIPADELRRLYLVECLPLQAIARRFGVSTRTIMHRRRALGIPTRPRNRSRPRKETDG